MFQVYVPVGVLAGIETKIDGVVCIEQIDQVKFTLFKSVLAVELISTFVKAPQIEQFHHNRLWLAVDIEILEAAICQVELPIKGFDAWIVIDRDAKDQLWSTQ